MSASRRKSTKARRLKIYIEDSMSSAESEMSEEHSASPVPDEINSPKLEDGQLKREAAIESSHSLVASPVNLSNDKEPTSDMMVKSDPDSRLIDQNGNASADKCTDSRGFPDTTRKRRASDELSIESSTKASESGALDDSIRDDDDDDENDDDDKLPSKDYDPERLKAFNMFVRLFVDENLDRMVPISKQPKDKVQAILEACHRQFPEFQDRSRKRIRTYLKSCRRMRRSKEQNGWEALRPTPPHLTSAAAEGILAQACDNESQNAKRMRMGMEPIAANAMPPPPSMSSAPSPPQAQPTTQAAAQSSPLSQLASQPTQSANTPISVDRPSISGTDFVRAHAPTAFRPPHEMATPFFTNGNGLFRPGFPGYQHPAHHHPSVLTGAQLTGQVQNGPADLSIKKSGSSKNQLHPTEVATIRQLIAGYRESAAFLYRSADELEQLLLQQN